MAETYEIIHEGEIVGTARTERQGLYCCFYCRCRLPQEGLYRIHVICAENREDLGICIPIDGAFGMDKRIPVKRLGDGVLQLELVPKDWQPQKEIQPEPEQTIFLPVSEEQPFEPLDKLENAILEVRDGETGILLPAEPEAAAEQTQP